MAAIRPLALGLVSVLALLALLAAACGGSSASTATSTTTSTTPVTSTSPPATTASTHCRSEVLTATLGPADAGAGQRYNALILTNTGTTTCELRGFPGVSLLDAAGTQIGTPASREGAEGATVSIPPGGRASATLHTNSAGVGATCTAASAKIRVYPPDNTVAVLAAASYSACGTFSVTTLVAGDAGR